MHHRADQLAKSLLREALSRAGTPETEVEVLAATQKIDVYSIPDPTRAAERAQMGLLGDLSAEPSLFEPFRNTPSIRVVRRCLNKQLSWHHELERRARATTSISNTGEESDVDESAGPSVLFPSLVIVSPGRPETVLSDYGCQPVSPGLYEAVRGLALRIVVLAELPRTRATLMLRLLGSRQVLQNALADLERLPPGSWEQGIASPLLLHFQMTPRDARGEEADVTEEIREWYAEYQQRQQQLLDKARHDGEQRVLAQLLRKRFGELPTAVVARLDTASASQLERWADRVLDAHSLADIFEDLH